MDDPQPPVSPDRRRARALILSLFAIREAMTVRVAAALASGARRPTELLASLLAADETASRADMYRVLAVMHDDGLAAVRHRKRGWTRRSYWSLTASGRALVEALAPFADFAADREGQDRWDAAVAALEPVRRQWGAPLLVSLRNGPLGSQALMDYINRSMPDHSDILEGQAMSRQMHHETLRHLVHCGVVERHPSGSGFGVRVSYVLSDYGRAWMAAMVPLTEWGLGHHRQITEIFIRRGWANGSQASPPHASLAPHTLTSRAKEAPDARRTPPTHRRQGPP